MNINEITANALMGVSDSEWAGIAKMTTGLLEEKKIFGVSQYCHGHEYRWIFDEKTLKEELKTDDVLSCSGEDIGFPIGGSNSSATWITELEGLSGAKTFLTAAGDGPDSEDPMLVDIAEYLLTVDTGDGSCTKEYLDKLGLKAEDLTQYDDDYSHQKKAESMIKDLKAAGYEDFDYDNPFYGENSDMTFYDLNDLHEEVVGV